MSKPFSSDEKCSGLNAVDSSTMDVGCNVAGASEERDANVIELAIGEAWAEVAKNAAPLADKHINAQVV